MNRPLHVAAPLLVLLIGAVGALAIVKARPEPAQHRPRAAVPVVEVQAVRLVDHQYRVHAQGTVRPRTESALVTEVSGRILSVSENFVEGGFFEQGEILLTLDDRDYRAALSAAEAQVATARLRVAQEEEESRVAREEWARFEEGEASPLVLRAPQLAEARASLNSAEASLERARRDLEHTRLRAPYAGRIRSKSADVGDFAQRGVPVARIYAVDYAEIRLPLPDEDLAYIDVPLGYRSADLSGQPHPEVLLHATFAGREHTWKGWIDRTEGEIDPRSRMVNVVVRVEDPYGQRGAEAGRPPLAVGMFVDAEILGRIEHQVAVLPYQALRGENQVAGEGQVAVVSDTGELRLRRVELLRETHDEVVVGAGLKAGEQVCVSRLESLVDGMTVQIARQDQAQGQPQ